ncbi:MAG: multiheme c-type cytochrome [Myxococcota bacterium]
MGESGTVTRQFLLWIGLLIVVAGCRDSDAPRPDSEAVESAASSAAARFVGSKECVQCHALQAEKWRGSHHDRAMEPATPESVEARFDGSSLRHQDQTWRFLRRGEEYIIELEESGRAKQELTVAYTFGVHPLQQYLVKRPDGRMQALPIAWDSRTQERGGQRWIDLQPEGPIPPEDPLHWDQLAYNWNSQCAACHSTNLVKGYVEADNRFDTQWSEVDVGCEACHGPGSEHVSSAVSGRTELKAEIVAGGSGGFAFSLESFSEQDWQRASGQRVAARVVARSHDRQLDICAPCHSRRTQIVDSPPIGGKFLDGYRPRLLDPSLYFEDGQIRDEVYVWGSFLQSRMHAAGVRCADCHDPHSLELRRPGNDLCTGCHAPESYATTTHPGPELESAGASCVACHMPLRVYMEVDGRRDHSFPIPRPARSALLESPDACQSCHPDRASAWATKAIGSWSRTDTTPRSHWSDHLIHNSALRVDAERWFEIASDSKSPPIVRANAWSRLAREAQASPSPTWLQARLREGSALERLGLVEMAGLLAPEARLDLLRPLLRDERRAIRIAAATALTDLPPSTLRPADRSLLARALSEYRASQEANAERPEAQVNLGVLAVQYGDLDAARSAYLRALERAAYFVPAYANLADLERIVGRDQAAVDWLRQALDLAPDEARTRYALGLALHRSGQTQEALSELALAAEAAPDQPRLVLGWALALDAANQRAAAIEALAGAIDTGLRDPDLYHALVTLQRDEGMGREARRSAAAWLDAWPTDRRAIALLGELASDR